MMMSNIAYFKLKEDNSSERVNSHQKKKNQSAGALEAPKPKNNTISQAEDSSDDEFEEF
jgi:hypothetical protein